MQEKNKMIIVLSRADFNQYIVDNNLNDITIERHPDIAIIEFFNSDHVENLIVKRCVELDNEYIIKNDISSRPFKKWHKNVLPIVCDDITHSHNNCELFNYSQAQSIMDFIKNNNAATTWVIHCSAGISRSGAVGDFLYKYFTSLGEDVVFPRKKDVKPNSRISRLLDNILRIEDFVKENSDKYTNSLAVALNNNNLILVVPPLELIEERIDILNNIKVKYIPIDEIYYDDVFEEKNIDDVEFKSLDICENIENGQ